MLAKIVATYLKYVSMDDIYPYSIDEVFIDATHYLNTYKMNAHDFARMLIQEVLKTTVSPLPQVLPKICIFARWLLISQPSTSHPTKTVCGRRAGYDDVPQNAVDTP